MESSVNSNYKSFCERCGKELHWEHTSLYVHVENGSPLCDAVRKKEPAPHIFRIGDRVVIRSDPHPRKPSTILSVFGPYYPNSKYIPEYYAVIILDGASAPMFYNTKNLLEATDYLLINIDEKYISLTKKEAAKQINLLSKYQSDAYQNGQADGLFEALQSIIDKYKEAIAKVR